MKGYIFGLLILIVMLTGCTAPAVEPPSSLPPTPDDQVVVQPAFSESDIEITPVDVLYSWEYKNKTHSVDVKLFEEEYQFFGSVEIEGTPEDSIFYSQLVNHPYEEDTFREIILDLKAYGYDDDETARLALAMVSNIPYNDALDHWTFGYETLYINEGVCADKTILAAGILDELGYDVVIFDYEDVNHMALGIRCQKQYAHWEDYCFVDVTDGIKMITDDQLYFYDYDLMLGEPTTVFDVSNNTKSFDAKWDYEQATKLNTYLDSVANLSAYLSDGYGALIDAEADLADYYKELQRGYPSKREYEIAEADYNDYLALYKEAKTEWSIKYAQLQSETQWLLSYEDEFGVDIYTPTSIGDEWKSDYTDSSNGWVIIG